MSSDWINGQPVPWTAELAACHWSGYTDGRTCRCHLCGVFFEEGHTVRFVFANFKDSGLRYGNFFVCDGCDGPDVVTRAVAHEAAGDRLHWYMKDRDNLPNHPRMTRMTRRIQHD